MKIMLYNIDHGGMEGNDRRGRWKKLSQVIRKANPDILFLLEAWEWDENDLKEFSALTGFPYSYLSKSNTKHNLAVLFKFQPADVCSYNEGFHHSVLHMHLNEKRSVDLFAVHLSPKKEDQRLVEIKKILQLAKQHEHFIVLGDFNSLSPLDNYDGKRLLAVFQKAGIQKFGTTQIEHRVIKKVMDEGLVDVFRTLNKNEKNFHTVPTLSKKGKSEHAAKLRLDYFFASPALLLSTKKIQIIKNPLTDKASDHYPIMYESKKLKNS